jgi:hypothetical protein
MAALSWMTLLPQQPNLYINIRKLITSPVKFGSQLSLLLVLSNITLLAAVYGEDRSEVELLNYAFGNYLGSGFYSSGGGEVFILNIPLATTLRPMTDAEAGWIVKYPVTLGIANIGEVEFAEGEIPDLDDVGTLSIVPGIEYLYPVLPNWYLAPFFDLGIARDLANETSVRVLGTGMKSFVNFDIGDNSLILGNRFLFADQESFDQGSHSNFSVFESGLDYIIPTDLSINGSVINLSFYFINYFYLDDLVLVDSLDDRISLENKNEIGFTVSLPKHAWLPDDSRLGFGVQVTQDNELYRLVFGSPLF